MKLHRFKDLDFGFAIVSPDGNIGGLKCTIRSIKNQYPNASYVCALAKGIPAVAAKEMKKICPVYKSRKDSITSLINTAMKRGHKEWNLIIMAGSTVRRGLLKKYSLFISDFYNKGKRRARDLNPQGLAPIWT